MTDDLPMRVWVGREGGWLSAHATPELLHGECILRRRIHLPLDEADRRTVIVWRRGMLAALGVVVGVMLAGALVAERYTGPANASADQRAFVTTCGAWDHAAGAVISLLLRGDDDIDLRRTSDAVFRLRRARRDCNAGSINFACRDYQAVIQMVPREQASAEAPPSCDAAKDRSRLTELPKG